MSSFIFFILFTVGILISIQYKNSIKAQKIYDRAFEIEQRNYNNPYNIKELNHALFLYKKCNKLIKKKCYRNAIESCQQIIDDYQRFHDFLAIARKQVKQKKFREALTNFLKADAIYSVAKLEAEIIECRENISRQDNYRQALRQSFKMAQEGNFQGAIAILEPVQAKFGRDDDCKFLVQLQRVCSAKECYRLGLLAERNGIIESAIQQYQEALQILPELIECQIRLAILSIKTNDPTQAIFYLKEINNTQSSYLRGFAYIQLGNWQQANKEWHSISQVRLDNQGSVAQKIIEHSRLTKICEIENLVDSEEWKIAASLSLDFIKQYHDNSVVQYNLAKCIQPALENKIWQSENWQEISNRTKQLWQEKQDIKSLHNWAISTYYQYQIYPHKIGDLIAAWSTVIANIKLDPSLQNISWLGGNSINFENVTQRLKQILDDAINTFKDKDIEEYLKLRDIYRKDEVMLSLAQENSCGVKTRTGLLILPNCYQHFKNYLPQQKLPKNIWGALYTDWGEAVAAWHKKDIARAIKVNPNTSPYSEIEHFAYTLISYYEGCYFLENKYWREAIKILQKIKLAIIVKPDWCNRIDGLCNMQRQYIEDFVEHLEFSKLWYLLIGSQSSKSYYVEHQSMRIGMDVDNKRISFKQAIIKLEELQNIEPDNLVAANIIKALKINLELETINYLWQQSQYEEAVIIARRSQYEKVRFAVAEVCLEIVLEILQGGNLTYESIQSLQKITQWAYELCPYEPRFQETYSQLKQLRIHN